MIMAQQEMAAVSRNSILTKVKGVSLVTLH